MHQLHRMFTNRDISPLNFWKKIRVPHRRRHDVRIVAGFILTASGLALLPRLQRTPSDVRDLTSASRGTQSGLMATATVRFSQAKRNFGRVAARAKRGDTVV